MMRIERLPANTENARKIWLLGLALMIIGLCCSNAFALDPMGPPNSELEQGMFRGGLEYSFSTMDLGIIEGKGIVYRNGEPYRSGTAASETIEKFKVNTLYATVGYGVFENCDVFVRLGAANATFGDSLWEEREDFESDMNLALGAGIKATLYKGFNWKIGSLFLINRSELDGELDSSAWTVPTVPQPHLVDISTSEMQIALGVTYIYSKRISIYGGPFAHFISGDFDYKFSRISKEEEEEGEGEEYFDTGEYSWEINEGPIYGGYLGAQISIAKNFSGNIEYQHTSNANVFGVNVMLRY